MNSLSKDLKNLLDNLDLVDMRFIINQTQIYAHKLVLAASSYFWKTQLFGNKTRNNEDIFTVVLSDIDPIIFKKIIEYLYTREILIDSKTVDLLMEYSSQFGIENLQHLCSEYYQNNLSSENCVKIHNLACKFKDENLKKISLKFLENHKLKENQVLKNSFLGMEKNDVTQLLLLNNLHGSEEIKLLAGIIEWSENYCSKLQMQTSPNSIQFVLEEPIKFIKFEYISAFHFLNLMHRKQYLTDFLVHKLIEYFNNSQLNDSIIKENVLQLEFMESKEKSVLERLILWGQHFCLDNNIDINQENLSKYISPFSSMLNFQAFTPTSLVQLLETKIFPFELILENLITNIQKLISSKTEYFIKSEKKPITSISEIKVLLIETNHFSRNDIISSIKSTGIQNVDSVDARNENVTFEQMKNYDCVFTFSYNSYKNPQEIGNALAIYVESGGGLVLAARDTLNTDDTCRIEGRIVSDGFLPMKYGKPIDDKPSFLGKILKNDHPILKNVKSFDGGECSYRIEGNATNGSSAVAFWNDGSVLVAEKTKQSNFGTVIVLNILPYSDKVCSNYWRSSSDGMTLIANSVVYVSRVEKNGQIMK
ncbi:btb/poz domain-containing [Anaeramoeba ignava]|uniref:Btb/poz domain-containing n=1 Tax=Anaeramoeba ignava TaxID=1746090 RepID=A0A9Q0RFZ8_ANAIG|nr:btb/poz domain-containing [Anaeramoeba ignava]